MKKMPVVLLWRKFNDTLTKLRLFTVRSQFDSSVPLQMLAVEIMFFHAYYVNFTRESEQESERFYHS